MSNNKLCAVLAAFMMVAVAGVVVVQFTDDSDAALGTYDQKINVYYWDGSQWQASTQGSYNLYQAINAAAGDSGLTPVTATGNSSWVSGYDPNRSYGEITSFVKIENDEPVVITDYAIKVWSGSAWVDYTDVPLGWIRPHADYGATVTVPGAAFSASANVAIVLNGQDATTLPTTGLQPLQTVAGNNNTLYTFTIHDDANELTFTDYKTVQVFDPVSATMSTTSFTATGIQGNNSVVAAGYGTDVYLALIDALGTNLVSDNIDASTGKILAWVEHQVFNEQNVYQYSYYTYYSWMVSAFGAGTDYDEDTGEYIYWGSYSGTYLQFSFGYYSQLSGAYNNQGSVFQFKYVRT